MELIFNDLSIAPISDDKFSAIEKSNQFAVTFGEARKIGFKKIRSHLDPYEIQLSEDYNMFDWLMDKTVPEIFRNLMFGIIEKPFIRDEDEEVQNAYILSEYRIKDQGELQQCHGLAAAFLYNTLSISLHSKDLWMRKFLEIEKISSNEISYHSIVNIAHKNDFEDQSIQDYILKIKPVEIIVSNIDPDSKKIHISDHHGKAELEIFSKKIIYNPYIEEIKSTDWGGKKFIRRINEDGTIELVLTKSARNYALLVYTTGRNFPETEKIAHLIEAKFKE